MHTKHSRKKLKIRDNLLDLGADGRIILKRIIKWDVRLRTIFNCA